MDPEQALTAVLWSRPLESGRTGTIRSEGARLFLRQLVRSCRRWQLCWLQLDLRGDLSLGMHPEVRDPRRSHVTPSDLQV